MGGWECGAGVMIKVYEGAVSEELVGITAFSVLFLFYFYHVFVA